MPLIDSNLAAAWDGGASSLYRCQSGGQPVGYQRSVKQQYIGNDPDALIAALVSKGLVQGNRIALVGAGFGWVSERLVELGYGPMASGTAAGKICNVDTSAWIQANKSNNATATIINADVNSATGRRTIKAQFGSNTAVIDWAVSEDVLPLLSGTVIGQNNEIVPFAQNLRALATNVAHWITTTTASGDARLNWKDLETWKTWVTPDFVIARNEGSRVL